MTGQWSCAVCGGRIGRDKTPRWFHWYRRDLKPRHRIVPVEVVAR